GVCVCLWEGVGGGALYLSASVILLLSDKCTFACVCLCIMPGFTGNKFSATVLSRVCAIFQGYRYCDGSKADLVGTPEVGGFAEGVSTSCVWESSTSAEKHSISHSRWRCW